MRYINADRKIATQKLYYQLDPLSRRSLLAYPSSLTYTGDGAESSSPMADAFILSSARSALAREKGIEMRALGGGEGGVIDLSQIRSEGQALNFDQAIESWTSKAGGKCVSQASLSPSKSDNRPICHLSIWTYLLKISAIHLNQI